MIVEGPVLEACVECWTPPDEDGTLPCGHEEGRHRWHAHHAWFVVHHPAIPRPLAGRFSYPLEDRRAVAFVARHRRVLRRTFAVDPDGPGVEWWVEVDPTPDLEALGLTTS